MRKTTANGRCLGATVAITYRKLQRKLCIEWMQNFCLDARPSRTLPWNRAYRPHSGHSCAIPGRSAFPIKPQAAAPTKLGIAGIGWPESVWRNRDAFNGHCANGNEASAGARFAHICVLRVYELSLVQRARDGICPAAARKGFSLFHAAHSHGELDPATTLAGHLEARAARNGELAPNGVETCRADGLQRRLWTAGLAGVRDGGTAGAGRRS